MTENATNKVITRFPPSPTGPLHIGNVRTAIFNYFFARQNDGKFIVRVEDTDLARSKKEYEEGMLDHLKWLGMDRDNEEIWHQTERTETYKKYLNKLIDAGLAYVSQETEGENKEVVRFRNPNEVVTFEDLIRGTVSIDTSDLGDFIIARNIDSPVYHLAVVVDDYEAGITHVIRGEDHISNTPRHILIQRAIGAPQPIYAHLPLILAPDRSKLSKRKHGESVSLDFYRNEGFLPEAVVNYMALLGWNPGTEQEIFAMDELIKAFDITKVQKGGAVFNVEKFKWVNKEHMKRLPEDRLIALIGEALRKSQRYQDKGWNASPDLLKKIAPVIMERVSVASEATDMLHKGELDYFFEEPNPARESLVWKNDAPEASRAHIEHAIEILSSVGEGEWNVSTIKESLWGYAESAGKGNVLWPMRYAMSGKEKSPDPFTLAALLGKDAAIRRLRKAVEILS